MDCTAWSLGSWYLGCWVCMVHHIFSDTAPWDGRSDWSRLIFIGTCLNYWCRFTSTQLNLLALYGILFSRHILMPIWVSSLLATVFHGRRLSMHVPTGWSFNFAGLSCCDQRELFGSLSSSASFGSLFIWLFGSNAFHRLSGASCWVVCLHLIGLYCPGFLKFLLFGLRSLFVSLSLFRELIPASVTSV